MRRPAAALLLLLAFLACRTLQAPSRVEEIPVRLGDGEVSFAVTSAGGPLPAFLVLHDDENTAVEAGLEAIRSRGGRLVEVKADGRRRVAFELGGSRWRFDPNRIFTEAGARADLVELNGSAPAEVLAEVQGFADAVLAVYGPAPLLITLHNNTEGEYSALTYAPGGELARDAAAVHLPPGADPDDFFFVTEAWLYGALAAEGFAVVLQDNERVTDDGSLSVRAARSGVPYVNVEARHGHREEQVRMLEALNRAHRLHSRTAVPAN